MKLNQMKAFTELMVTGSVSEAARNLGRTQPSVSTLVSALEDYLGVQLFERRNSRLYPMQEAQYLFEECSDILMRIETISQNMKKIRSLQSGELKIAAMPGPSVFFIPELVAAHGLDHEDITCTMVSRTSEAVYQLISAQQYDLGIADYDPNEPADTPLLNSQIFSFDCVCAIPKKHALAKQTKIATNDLDGEPIGILYPEEPIHQRIQRAFEDSGAQLNARFMTQNFISLMTFVEKGLACAIVDPVTAESYRLYRGGKLGVDFRPLEPGISFDIALLTPTHRPSSHIANYFREKVAEELERLSSGA